MEYKIVKTAELKAPLKRVWKALIDHQEFGEWFRVDIEKPFQAGQTAKGKLTYPGYEHLKWEVQVKEIQEEKLFSFTWHPYAIDANVDYSNEEPTLVAFTLKEIENGTLLTVTESGFEKVPEQRREEAYRMNSGGWAEQMKNIETHVVESARQL